MNNEFEGTTKKGFEETITSRLEELKHIMLRRTNRTAILNEFKKDLLHLLSTQEHWTFSELSTVISALIRSRY